VETWDAIRARRNVRSFADSPISPEDLERILEAGRRAPSSMNSQPWDFVVCTEQPQLQALAKVWRHAAHVATSSATVALIAPESEDCSVEYDLGQATMSMMLAAADLGIGSGHASVKDQDLARQILGLPEDRPCAYLVAFGYPADRPLAPMRRHHRRPFDEVVHLGRWKS